MFAAGSRVPVTVAPAGRLVTDETGRIINLYSPKPKKTRIPRIKGFGLKDFYDESDVLPGQQSKQSKAQEIFDFATTNDFDQLATVITAPGGLNTAGILRSSHRFFLFYKKEDLIAVASYLHENWTITSLILKQGMDDTTKRGVWKALETQISRVLKSKHVSSRWYIQIFPNIIEKSGVNFIKEPDYGWRDDIAGGAHESFKKPFNERKTRVDARNSIWRDEEIV